MFDRKVFFDEVRRSLFGGKLTQQQVDGMDFKLQQWEAHPYHPTDLRWLSYPFATSMHETASTMWPIEEYGKGQGHAYGQRDPETRQTYYGRGDVQLTWRENYRRAARELGLQGTPDDLEWHATQALDPKISADVMFMGMREGWFRTRDGKPENLVRYFSATKDDPFGARGIINGDKNRVPSWSNGVPVGTMIAGYHRKFLDALEQAEEAYGPDVPPVPEPPKPELPEPPIEPEATQVLVAITQPPGVEVTVTINGEFVATP